MTTEDLDKLQARVNAYFADPKNVEDFRRRMDEGQKNVQALGVRLRRMRQISPELMSRRMTV